MNKDIYFMEKVLLLAESGAGKTNPNPLVGSVIVKNDKIIAEGIYKTFGGDHAELLAIKSSMEDLKDSTMYINLEPCICYGKNPPCINSIIESGIKKVVISMIDPNPEVSGKAIKYLNEAGIEVLSGVLEEKSRKLNEIYIKYITQKLPFIIMKSAMTLDGKISTDLGESNNIISSESKKKLHNIRNRVASIITGSNTVLTNNPFFTTRLENKIGTNSIKIVIDSEGKIPFNYNIYDVEDNKISILATTSRVSKEYINILKDKGVNVIVTGDEEKVNLNQLIKELYNMNIDSILLEAGGILNAEMLKLGLVDKVVTFLAPKIIGGKMGKTPVYNDGVDYLKDAIQLESTEIEKCGNDVYIESYILKRS